MRGGLGGQRISLFWAIAGGERDGAIRILSDGQITPTAEAKKVDPLPSRYQTHIKALEPAKGFVTPTRNLGRVYGSG